MSVSIATHQCRGCGAPLQAFERAWCQRLACTKQAFDAAYERAKQLPEEDRIRLARQALIGKAQRARESLVDFFELVLRDEATNQPVSVPPHQKTMISFIKHPKHDKCVLIIPVGCAKTVSCGGIGLHLLMRNHSMRGVFISATQEQAKKPLMVVRQTIETSSTLRLIDPTLLPTRRKGEPWSDTKITVDRPVGIKDPSFAALGIDSKEIQGWRVDYAIVDDLLSHENTSTPEQRESTYKKFFGQVANRIEPRLTSKLIVVNTTWHHEDYVNRIARAWPTLRMTVTGDIFVSNADPDWSPDEIYVVGTKIIQEVEAEHCRLTEHYPDPEKKKPLWAERYSIEQIERERIKYIHAPGLFKKFFMSDAHDDETAICKEEFIERCKRLARQDQVFEMVPAYNGSEPTFTGVDLAVTPDKKGGETVFFTFRITDTHMGSSEFVCMKCASVQSIPQGFPKPVECSNTSCTEDGKRTRNLSATTREAYTILDIEGGHWDALTIVAKLFTKIVNFRSFAAVENNATQEYLIQIARTLGRDLPVRSHNTTQQGKAHPWQGVIGIFFEMATGRWRIPNDPKGNCEEPIRNFISKCTSYTPERHTADVLMASFIARKLAMDLGYMASEPMLPPGMLRQEERALRR